jgi:thioredoxin-like negative regulator of GroEL
MQEIKAFVGHSFSPEDRLVVSAFLNYLSQLEELLPNFSWEHAEAAEPIELAEKVRSRFAGKNVFIGICTAKEFAIAKKSLSPLLFRPTYLKAVIQELAPKTSDWVTQEIGFALGRGLETIILQEDGIRRPGGLQGDKEYIEFNRQRPEQAFGKILEMLSALSPAISKPGASGDVLKTDPVSEAELLDNDWLNPKPDWDESEYRTALLHLVALGQLDKANEVRASFAVSDVGKTGEAADELAAHLEFLKIMFGQPSNLNRLHELAAQHPKNIEILANLAKSQAQFDNHGAAAETYEAAASLNRSSTDGLFYLGRAALEFAKNDNQAKAQALVEEIKRNTRADSNLERQLASVIGDLSEIRKEEDSVAVALERTVDLFPDDYDARFNLAYRHSQLGNDDLAFYHYLKIPYDSRSAIAWNNLGVSYDHFSMRAASVHAYRISEERGETLAMSNLGYKFIRQGFVEEAKAEFEKGFAIKGHHKNIEEGLSELTKLSDQENQKKREVLEKVLPKANFYRALSNAIASTQIVALPTHFNAPECALIVTLDGDRFSAVGTYKRESSSLGLFGGGIKEVKEYRIEYVGRVTGRQIEATVGRIQTAGPQYNSLLAVSDTKTKVLMYLEEDGGTIKVMEHPHSTGPTFYNLTPVAD